MSLGKTPIVVGAAQVTQRWSGTDTPDHPLALMAKAGRAALADSGSTPLAGAVDWVAVVNILTWSYADAPGSLARDLGIEPTRLTYTTIGGNSPQYLVHRAAEALAAGRYRAVLLAGAETGDALAQARKLGRRFDEWPARSEPAAVEGDSRLGISSIEQAYDLFLPSSMYPFIETTIRAAAGRTPDAHREHLGRLFARFAAVAHDNPHAWFREAHAADRIAKADTDNRYVGYPYTKLMNAIMSVDQAAALVLTTEEEATKLGIDPSRWVYPMGGADLNEVWHVTERASLERSPAIRQAARNALSRAGTRTSEITAFDLYSCFPAAVELALDALEIGAEDPRDLTITGGLPYFGGPGNNYSMHAIATAVDRIRKDRDARVLISALGWYATKHSVGVYGGRPPAANWGDFDDSVDQAAIDASAVTPPVERAEGVARIVAFVIRHGRDGAPIDATALVRMQTGERALAMIEASASELEAIEREELVGRLCRVRHDTGSGLNRLRLS
jgi:acetyl-CoA C-acetyltransferase